MRNTTVAHWQRIDLRLTMHQQGSQNTIPTNKQNKALDSSFINEFHMYSHNCLLRYIAVRITLTSLGYIGKSIRSWCDGSSDRSFMVNTLSYFSFQPVLHDWCNKGCGMYYTVCGMMHIKEPLLLIRKSSPCGGSGFPFSLSEWSFTICLMPYNRK